MLIISPEQLLSFLDSIRLSKFHKRRKRKIGLITGVVKRDTTDATKQDAWDTCNSMVISWILANVSESIRKSILFVDNAAEIWRLLEQRLTVSNGSRKYKLNKEIYELKQQGKSTTEYYTEMKGLWEELESLSSLPVLSKTDGEIKGFLEALHKQQ